jgi:hypothetical protein
MSVFSWDTLGGGPLSVSHFERDQTEGISSAFQLALIDLMLVDLLLGT